MRVKLDRRFQSVNLYATLLFALLAGACYRAPRAVVGNDHVTWAEPLGDARRTPYLDQRVPADPTIQWEERYGRGFTDVPSVSGDLLISSSTAKTVTVANAAKGTRFWERRLNGAVAGTLVRYNNRVYAATQSRDGRVEALQLGRGRHAWTFRMHAPAVGSPLLVDSTLYTGSERAELFALRIDNGQPRWRVRLPSPLTSAPLRYRNELIVFTTRDSIVRVDAATGRVSAGSRMSGTVSAPAAVIGDRMLVPVHPGMLQSVRLADLGVMWTAKFPDPILAAPAVDTNGDAYILTRASELWRVDTLGAATRIAQLGNAAAASLTITADGLLVGTLDGTARLVRRDGSIAWARSFPHSIRSPIAIHDGSIYVPLGDGHLVMLR